MHILRYEGYKLNEDQKHTKPTLIGDVFLSNDQELYKLDVFYDASCFRLYFPDGKYVGYENSILDLADELNPFIQYEGGKLLTWMRQVVFPERYDYFPGWEENISGSPKSEIKEEQIEMKQFCFMSDDGMIVPFEISDGGLIKVRIPERYITGSIDQIYGKMPEMGFLWNGALIHTLKKEFYNVTGINLGN